MKNNIFKINQPKEEDNSRGYYRKRRTEEEIIKDERFMKLYGNKYKIDNKKEEKPEININEMHFPELGSNHKKDLDLNSESQKDNKMNYKEASKKENVEISEPYKIPEGWALIYFNEKNEVIRENGVMPKSAIDRILREQQSTHFSNVVKHLTEKWSEFKEQYIDLYGFDEYEKTYLYSNEDNYNIDLEFSDESDIDESDYSYYDSD